MKKINQMTLEELGNFLDLSVSKDVSELKEPIDLQTIIASNRMVIQPMEGNDATLEGSPSELTYRRYERYAKGGAGLVWIEAVSIAEESRTSPHQLWIREDNVNDFKALVDFMKQKSKESFSHDFNQAYILQITHSGRYSKPKGTPEPIITHHNPYLDTKMKVPANTPILTDEDLERLEALYEEKAVLAYQAGFHGVDIKCSHRYLISELTSAFTRQGKYGNDFDGRTRFILNVVKRIKKRLGDSLMISVRLNLYDQIPYPYGFGVSKTDVNEIDYTEPLKLIQLLKENGVHIVNITMGTPYYNPHINRPHKNQLASEDPLVGVKRLIDGAITVQKTFPDLVVVGTGYSYLRQFAPYIANSLIKDKLLSMVGFGRLAFCYPDFPKDILTSDQFVKEKCCISCSKCSELKGQGVPCGCVIRDKDYLFTNLPKVLFKGEITC